MAQAKTQQPKSNNVGRASHLTEAEYLEAKSRHENGESYNQLFKEFGFASKNSMKNAFSKGITRFATVRTLKRNTEPPDS